MKTTTIVQKWIIEWKHPLAERNIKKYTKMKEMFLAQFVSRIICIWIWKMHSFSCIITKKKPQWVNMKGLLSSWNKSFIFFYGSVFFNFAWLFEYLILSSPAALEINCACRWCHAAKKCTDERISKQFPVGSKRRAKTFEFMFAEKRNWPFKKSFIIINAKTFFCLSDKYLFMTSSFGALTDASCYDLLFLLLVIN